MYCYFKGNSLLVSPVSDLGMTHYPSLGKGGGAGEFGSNMVFREERRGISRRQRSLGGKL